MTTPGAGDLGGPPVGYVPPEMPGTAPGPSAGITFARKVVVSGPNGGVFIYQSGTTPALGNPPIAWLSSGLVDPFGNVLPSSSGIAGSGTFSAGNQRIYPQGTVGYSSSTPALNGVIFSEAPAQFTDGPGNLILAGTTTYGVSGITYYALNQLPGTDRANTFGSLLTVYTAASMAGPWNIGGQINFAGSAVLDIIGDQIRMYGATGQPVFSLHSTQALLSPAALLTADAQGTLTQAVNGGFTGQVPATQTDTTTNTNANGAGATRITAIYNLPAGDVAGTTYTLWTPFSCTMQSQTLQLGLSVDGASAFSGSETIGGAIVAAGVGLIGSIGVKMRIMTTGAGGTFDCYVFGWAGQAATNALFNNRAALVGQSRGVAYDTTVTHTMRINSLWGASAAGQTVSGFGSELVRTGP